jgi:hypothetical protein
MCELFCVEHPRVPHRDTVPGATSIGLHLPAVGAVAAVPLLYIATEQLRRWV